MSREQMRLLHAGLGWNHLFIVPENYVVLFPSTYLTAFCGNLIISESIVRAWNWALVFILWKSAQLLVNTCYFEMHGFKWISIVATVVEVVSVITREDLAICYNCWIFYWSFISNLGLKRFWLLPNSNCRHWPYGYVQIIY